MLQMSNLPFRFRAEDFHSTKGKVEELTEEELELVVGGWWWLLPVFAVRLSLAAANQAIRALGGGIRIVR